MTFKCECCDHQEPYPSWVGFSFDKPNVHRCGRCDTSYSVTRGIPTRIHPPLFPIDVIGLRRSPWHDGRRVPYVNGIFDCVFKDYPDTPVRLRWDGYFWYWRDRRADTRTLLKWRGNWGNT